MSDRFRPTVRRLDRFDSFPLSFLIGGGSDCSLSDTLHGGSHIDRAGQFRRRGRVWIVRDLKGKSLNESTKCSG